jgi:hypothetical protein
MCSGAACLAGILSLTCVLHPVSLLSQVRIQAASRAAMAGKAPPGAPPPGVSKIGQLVPPPAGSGLPRLDFKEMGRWVG